MGVMVPLLTDGDPPLSLQALVDLLTDQRLPRAKPLPLKHHSDP